MAIKMTAAEFQAVMDVQPARIRAQSLRAGAMILGVCERLVMEDRAAADQQTIDACLAARIDQRAAALRAIYDAKERHDGAPLNLSALDDGWDASVALGHLEMDVAVLEPFSTVPF